MNVLRNIIEGIGSVIGNGLGSSSSSNDINLDLPPILPITLRDVRYELPDPELPYDTDEEANRHFANSYWKYMTQYYAGRQPQFRSDLYCAMFPVDIVFPVEDSREAQRYWWMAVNHPIARIIENNPEYKSEGVWDSVYYGACVVYHCDIIELFIDGIADMLLAQGRHLEGTTQKEDNEYDEENQAEQQPLNYSDWANSQPAQQQQSVISALAARVEGSKKAD
jgi:hypothetical protein